jgi:DMSO/TMAO reductase YedYZ molybdopterin-dependent catalytic subunit
MTTQGIMPNQAADHEVEQEIRRMTRRSFSVGAVSALAGLAGFGWVKTQGDDDGIQWPLRRLLQWNEMLAEACFSPSRLAPTFAPGLARMPRANGRVGLTQKFDPASWSLRVESPALKTPVELTLDEIKALPRFEMVTELKCIEGWSDPVRWAGARLVDLADKLRAATRSIPGPGARQQPADRTRYAMLETPDKAYYVGLDIASALHPQTLLCYEMNGEPLTLEHGAPLRLAIPVKYGIKNIKRIGTIRFTDERPADYWAERGYDWYAGH